MIRRIIPSRIKPALRFVRYGYERRRFFREIEIKKKQDEQIIASYNPKEENLIVFVVMGGVDRKTGKESISGGLLSIFSIYDETRKLKSVHQSETIMVTLKDEPLRSKHVLFENNVDIFRVEQLSSYFTNVRNVIIHIPEFVVDYFIDASSQTFKSWLKSCDKVHINVLNQHILLMPQKETIDRLKTFTPIVTSTTAHQKYCTEEFSRHYQISVHKFSTFVTPENYHFREFGEKENLIIVSPDPSPYREAVMEKLNAIEGLRVVVIENMTYAQFKAIISLAKWSLTFGEGLDGYLVEPIFSGAIGFAVYNEEFFTDDFEHANGIYASYEDMLANVVNDIKRLDNAHEHKAFQKGQFELCYKHYNYKVYQQNVKLFYQGKYTFK